MGKSTFLKFDCVNMCHCSSKDFLLCDLVKQNSQTHLSECCPKLLTSMTICLAQQDEEEVLLAMPFVCLTGNFPFVFQGQNSNESNAFHLRLLLLVA